MAIDWEQEVEVHIAMVNIKHYREHGYTVNVGDKAIIKAKDLLKTVGNKINYTCDICGKEFTVGYGTYNRHKGDIDTCSKCASSTKRADKLRIDYEEICKMFKDNNCELITDKYTGCRQTVEYIATCGHNNKIRLVEFKSGYGRKCKSCSGKYKSYDSIKDYYINNGCTLLSTEYKRSDEKLLYIAQCGHENTIEYRIFKSGQGRKCPKCAMPSGEDHSNYKPWLTDKDREYTRNIHGYQIWRNNVFIRDKYTCQCCSRVGGSIRSHHIEDYSHNPELRTELSNGITLCKNCHDDFHTIYGKYNGNNRKQLDEFLRLNKDTIKDAI